MHKHNHHPHKYAVCMDVEMYTGDKLMKSRIILHVESLRMSESKEQN